jgi:hypothetical protein
LRKILRKIKYYLWALNGFWGLRSRTDTSQKATILFTYFSPVRMKHINHQLRNIFKCDFVGQVIISNHNPDVDIASLIKVMDERIKVVNQNVRRGCGHRWLVANEFSPEYLIVVDDDVLIFPGQLKKLFEALVTEPEMPHGFAGMVQHSDGYLEYRQEEERSLDYICEIYALTGAEPQRPRGEGGPPASNAAPVKIKGLLKSNETISGHGACLWIPRLIIMVGISISRGRSERSMVLIPSLICTPTRLAAIRSGSPEFDKNKPNIVLDEPEAFEAKRAPAHSQ